MTSMASVQKEYQHLLQNLKLTVDGLLIRQVSNVWSIYGGLNRVHNAMEKILKHGCRVFTPQGDPDCWVFIQGLSWLAPSLAQNSPTFLNDLEESLPQLPPSMNSKAMIWLYKSLESHSLSQKLSWLLSDRGHLHSCFENTAFLCQEIYGEATLFCLKAVERNQAALLAEINPSLYLAEWNYKEAQKVHRRCSSFPQAEFKEWNKLPEQNSAEKQETPLPEIFNNSLNINVSHAPFKDIVFDKTTKIQRSQSFSYFSKEDIKKQYKSLSLPNNLSNLTIDSKFVILCNMKINEKNNKSMKSTYQGVNVELKSPEDPTGYGKINNNKSRNMNLPETDSPPPKAADLKEIKLKKSIYIRPSALRLIPRTTVSGSAPERVPNEWDRKQSKKRFIEDGARSVNPMATGFFPRPIEGQSIQSFLTSGLFSSNVELDRENAHFSISEAMISAIEQIKSSNNLRQAMDTPEINHLKQRIRLRRSQNMAECQRTLWGNNLLSDGKTDTTTTDQSASPITSSTGTPSESISTEGVDDLDVDEVKNLSDLNKSALSVSMASLYSEADLSKNNSKACAARQTISNISIEKEIGSDTDLTAENVALSLIRHFNMDKLPKASDLEWLVSEQDAPQQLLPLPLSMPISPDEAEDADMRLATPLRGTIDWAPPRRQVIFTLHPSPNRGRCMTAQGYRCAGCGMKVAHKYANRFRYCEYLGKFFCTGCHTNQLAVIPARILTKWDFSRYPVSNFSYRLLEQMAGDHLFSVDHMNPSIYRKIRNLDRIKPLRLQVHYLKEFLSYCKHAKSLKEEFNLEPSSPSEFEMFSINDFLQLKSGELIERSKELMSIGIEHITNCELCQARAFICELCTSRDVFYPWQLNRVMRCKKCGACFHLDCWKTNEELLNTNQTNTVSTPCSRCVRLEARRQQSPKDEITEENN